MWKLSRPVFFNCFLQTSFNKTKQNVRLVSFKLTPSKWEQPSGFETGISLYHPKVKDKVPLILRHENLLHWYACGPTVYDSAHIGHASSYVRQDVIRRIFKRYFGIDSIMVMGITDIDDKIIDRSYEESKPFQQLTSLYETEFFSDLKKLNVMQPSIPVRVTEHIPHIIHFIDGIVKRGCGYITPDGSVYFDLEKYSLSGQHGVFSEREIKPTDISDSVEGESLKKNIHDFALWKGYKPGEPYWESPWGRGRPGWHIECSAMASSIYGCNFDLHSGGEDLLFPHHECEVLQSCVFHDVNQWANYWFHTGHLYIAGQQDKMSKSLKNVISVSELLENYTSNQFRMLCLLTSYRKQIEFGRERMAKAVTTLKMFQSVINRCNTYIDGQMSATSIPEAEMYHHLDTAKKAVVRAFADDFNTPQALARVVRLVKEINLVLKEDSPDKTAKVQVNPVRSPAVVALIKTFIQDLLQDLGIDIIGTKKESTTFEEGVQFQKVMDVAITSRDKLRVMAKNKKAFLESADYLEIHNEKASELFKKWSRPLWEISDEMREQLLEKTNVQITDGVNKSTWSIVERMKKDNGITEANTKGKG